MNKKTILISCSGLGMGNASRMCALLEELVQENKNLDIYFASWGKGFNFIEQFISEKKIQCHKYKLFDYKKNFFKAYIKNTLLLKKLMNKINPDLIILDSDYHYFSFLGGNAYKVFVGQAFDTISRAKKMKLKLQNNAQRFSYYAREYLDYLYQKLLFDAVFVPQFTVDANLPKPFIGIPLIVRKEFLRSRKIEQSFSNKVQRIGIMLSGSTLECEDLKNLSQKYDIQILGKNKNDVYGEIIHSEDIDLFDIVLTQCGLSSISELLSKRKTMILSPMNNHIEQIVNAETIVKMNCGFHLKDNNYLNISNSNCGQVNNKVSFDGASKIVHKLCEVTQFVSESHS